MSAHHLLLAGIVLGAITVILFITGQSTLGVVSAIVTGTVFAIHSFTVKREKDARTAESAD